MKKALLVTNIPNPYRIPLFNELASQLARHSIELHVVFGAAGYKRRMFDLNMEECQFRYTVLQSRDIAFWAEEATIFTYPGLIKVIRNEQPDIIISNAFSFATVKIWLRSWFRGTPFLIWSGAISARAKPDSPLRRVQRRLLVRRASGFIAYGSLAKDYLVSMGAREEDVHIGINTVDTEFFAKETLRLREAVKKDDGVRHILCVSYLTPRKRVEQLLYLMRALTSLRDDVVLDIVGDGSERAALERLANELGVAPSVRFHGFVQKQWLPEYFAQATVFLFPTDFDVWGLVLVEAMSAGLVCIVSPNAGAARDLVSDAVTGYVADLDDADSVAELVDRLLRDDDLCKRIGESASCFVSEHVSIPVSAAGFSSAIRKHLR